MQINRDDVRKLLNVNNKVSIRYRRTISLSFPFPLPFLYSLCRDYKRKRLCNHRLEVRWESAWGCGTMTCSDNRNSTRSRRTRSSCLCSGINLSTLPKVYPVPPRPIDRYADLRRHGPGRNMAAAKINYRLQSEAGPSRIMTKASHVQRIVRKEYREALHKSASSVCRLIYAISIRCST